MRIISEMAEANEAQVWIERVGDGASRAEGRKGNNGKATALWF